MCTEARVSRRNRTSTRAILATPAAPTNDEVPWTKLSPLCDLFVRTKQNKCATR